jgi:hypothetical protein
VLNSDDGDDAGRTETDKMDALGRGLKLPLDEKFRYFSRRRVYFWGRGVYEAIYILPG